jgi:hypothetical protein
MSRKNLQAALDRLIERLPDDAVDVSAGETTIEIFINWAKVPDE